MIKRALIRVQGNVQGVFFRHSAREKARELNITGFARNEKDGSVYLEAEGEEAALEKFTAWCRIGPSHAVVESVESSLNDELKHFNDFSILKKISMKIESPAFAHNERIPLQYTCDGNDSAPTLHISGVPENAKSLVLIMDDPDAPRGTWVHWTMWNIDPKTTEIKDGEIPKGAVEGVTSFGKPGYGGPCPPRLRLGETGPPSGTHRYFFKLYALDTVLDLAASADKTALESAMAGHIVESTELIGLYSRSGK